VRRVLIIARSEFLTAVRARGFLIGIMLMPILFGSAVVLQRVVERQANQMVRRVAIIDDTGRLFQPLQAAVDSWNRGEREIGPRVADGPRFTLEKVAPPAGADRQALLLSLSQRVRSQDLFAFVELPAGLLGDERDARIRYYSAAPAYRELPDWLQRAVLKEVVKGRFEQAHVSPLVVASLLKPIATEELGLLDRAPSGEVQAAREVDRIRTSALPVALMLLLFLIVMMTTPQLLNSVLEEKMSRISEVMLGAVTPFELMLGKLLASTAVSAVMTLVYVSGAAWTAHRWGYLDALQPSLLGWFVVFLLLSVLMYGAMFIAIGSACSDLRDAQNLMTPAMMMLMIPALTWTLVVRAPQSAVSVGASLFPPATPFLMLLRLALPERPPSWQVAVGVLLTIGTMLLIVWAAGRIVRVGLLMQGKAVRFGELWHWIRA
jgi:ABC-2 type transport system permease protein